MPLEPRTQARPQIRLAFQLGGLANIDYGYLFKSLEFRAMVNGGYIVRAKLFDSDFNLLNKLMEAGYLRESRRVPIYINFQILSGPTAVAPDMATTPQSAIILSLNVTGGPYDLANLEFVAIDPPSWFLNTGDASGGVYKGRVDQVIKQVVQQYAPSINVEVGRTTDSTNNKWWMMRQDPRTFITSLMDWSASITQKHTQWLVETNGDNLTIKEQGATPSKQRGFYRFHADKRIDTIETIDLKADNALSIVQAKLITAGSAAISGHYLDRITDPQHVAVKDQTTANKQIARTSAVQSFTKPPDTKVGWTEITAIPEIYSAGDLGLQYEDYIDGRPRSLWLSMINILLRAKFTILGHGEWSACAGLGVDTVFVKWRVGPRTGGETFWWVTGTWLVYGFHHRVELGSWLTDLYCARYDFDSAAQKVGFTPPS